MPFIQDYLEHTKDYETPTSFWTWSAYSTISAVLRDNTWRKMGDSVLFPSMYILLLGGSGSRKDRPVVFGEELVRKTGNTKVISGRASIQAILDELANTETDRKTGKILKGGSAIFYAPELSAGLVEDPSALKILTDIYGAKLTEYTSYLRSSPKFKIERLVFSLFAASNEALVKDLYSQQAKEGGLLARTFLVTPDEFRPRNSLMDYTSDPLRVESLVTQLKEISKLKGEYTWSQESIQEYNSWYIPFGGSLKHKNDRTGVLSRIHTSVLKLAMVLAANDLSLNVSKAHIEEAIYQSLKLLPNYNMFSMTSGKGSIESAGSVVLEALLKAPKNTMTQGNLLRDNWASFDIEMLEKVTLTFEVGGLITRLVQGSVISYTLTPKALEILSSSHIPDKTSKIKEIGS